MGENENWLASNWGYVVLGVVGGVIALWLITILTAFTFSSIFRSSLKKQSDAVNLLLTQRRDSMIAIIKIFVKHKIEVSPEDVKSINKLERIDNFQALSKDERDEKVLTFVHGSHNILNLADLHEEVKNDEEFELAVNLFNDVEAAYRKKVSAYNSKVLGFNYWIKIPTTKFIFKLFKCTDTDLIFCYICLK